VRTNLLFQFLGIHYGRFREDWHVRAGGIDAIPLTKDDWYFLSGDADIAVVP
jgi:hypothetical protein